MSTQAIRLRLYALLTAVESDLRSVIDSNISPQRSLSEIFGEETVAKLHDRRRKDADAYAEGDKRSIIEYADLGDAIDAVRREASLLGTEALKHYKSYHSKLASSRIISHH